ncbi:trypco2 family protein [Arthrobacter sp. MDT2-16]
MASFMDLLHRIYLPVEHAPRSAQPFDIPAYQASGSTLSTGVCLEEHSAIRYGRRVRGGFDLNLSEWGGEMDKVVVGLADAIEALRGELLTAAVAGEDQAMRFSVEPVELTVQVAVTKDANGKVGWTIFGAGGGYEHVTTQTLTLRLAPLWQCDDGTLTSDFAISSRVSPGEVIGPRRGRSGPKPEGG